MDHFVEGLRVGFGELDIQGADHKIEEVFDGVVFQHACHGVRAIGGHGGFVAGPEFFQ